MISWSSLSIVLGFSLLCWVLMLVLIWTVMRSSSLRAQQQEQAFLTAHRSTLESLDKATALAASGDALTYQAIRLPEAVETYPGGQYDPSDAGEVERINARYSQLKGELTEDPDEEQLDGTTEAALSAFFSGD